jgi:hypothetical protein
MPRLQTLDSVGYVRPSVTNGSSQGSASSGMLSRCIPMGPFASMFAPKKQPEPYEDAPTGKILEILRVRNRFAIVKEAAQSPDGFRDLVSQVKAGLQVLAADAVCQRAQLFQPANAALAGVLEGSE